MTRQPSPGQPRGDEAWAPPSFAVICDDVPKAVHVRDEGHVCKNPKVTMPPLLGQRLPQRLPKKGRRQP